MLVSHQLFFMRAIAPKGAVELEAAETPGCVSKGLWAKWLCFLTGMEKKKKRKRKQMKEVAAHDHVLVLCVPVQIAPAPGTAQLNR